MYTASKYRREHHNTVYKDKIFSFFFSFNLALNEGYTILANQSSGYLVSVLFNFDMCKTSYVLVREF